MKIQYVSTDGVVFNSGYDCAKHELKNSQLLQIINEKVATVEPLSIRWCNSNGCGCMGCINFQFDSLGLTEFHFDVWNNEIREHTPYFDQNSGHSVFTFKILNAGPNFKDVIEFIKKETNSNLQLIYTALKNNTYILEQKNKSYMDMEYISEQCVKLGATVELSRIIFKPNE